MEESKIFVSFKPSLLHMATVKEAINLYKAFCMETLYEAYRRIHLGISITSEDSKNFLESNTAQRRLLLIPPKLRKRVIEAVHGLEYGVQQWKDHHSTILKIDDRECKFYWRSDGTVDTIQTAKKLVLNSNIDIRNRFYLACMYCLEENVKTLWAEIESTGETESLETDRYWVVKFWVKLLHDAYEGDWKKYAATSLDVCPPLPVRISSFFSTLGMMDRRRYSCAMLCASHDDFRLCLLLMTKEEEIAAVTRSPLTVLRSYLHWPMQSLFIEIAEMVLKYFTPRKYDAILEDIFNTKENREFFDFTHFFECFWNVSPSHLRETAIESSKHRDKIESLFKEINTKRKIDVDEFQSQRIKKFKRN